MEQPSLLISFLPLAIIIAIAWMITLGIKTASKKYPPVAPEKNTVSGVGGWLLLLILGLMFLGPFMGAGRINSEFIAAESQNPNLKSVAEWGTFKSATWWTFLFLGSLSFYAGLCLVKGRSVLVLKRAIIILWVIGPIGSLVLAIFLPLFIFRNAASNQQLVSRLINTISDPQLIGGIFGTIIAAAIWTAYLVKSKRVQATYGCITPNSNGPKKEPSNKGEAIQEEQIANEKLITNLGREPTKNELNEEIIKERLRNTLGREPTTNEIISAKTFTG